MKKIAVVTSHPIQYQAPLCRAMSQQSDIDLTVYFGCDYGSNATKVHPGFGKAFAWDIPLLDGYKHVFLKNSKATAKTNQAIRDTNNIGRFFRNSIPV